jgi:putative transposase
LGGARGRLIVSADRMKAIDLITQACKEGARKAQACEMLNLSLRTIERWEKAHDKSDQRHQAQRVPKNKLILEERNRILTISNSEKYRDLPPCKIVPLLADTGQYVASESSFYRVLRAENQLSHRGRSKPKKYQKPKQFIATRPNQVWSWDISYLPTQVSGIYFYLYVVMDIYSRKIVGWSVHERELSDYGAHLIEQACHDENVERDQVVLHSDNGSPMKGMSMLLMLEKLGVLPSFSRPSVSDDNPYSESLFKTLKYHPTFPALMKFSVINDARIWCEKFSGWYNKQHLHSGLKFITPEQRHCGEDRRIMENRQAVYQYAKQRHPERWTKNTRNWVLPEAVMLNPNKEKNVQKNNIMMEETNTYSHEMDSIKNPSFLGKCGFLST